MKTMKKAQEGVAASQYIFAEVSGVPGHVLLTLFPA